jgi:putative oxidoreductase
MKLNEMKKFFSTRYTAFAFDIALFLLRVTLGLLMCLVHGIPKISNFSVWKTQFYDPFHIGSRWSLVLVIIAEVFGSMLLVIGLFSRLAALVLSIDMVFASFIYHAGHPLTEYEHAILFLTGFLCVLLLGPGKWSADGMAGK